MLGHELEGERERRGEGREERERRKTEGKRREKEERQRGEGGVRKTRKTCYMQATCTQVALFSPSSWQFFQPPAVPSH